MSAHLVLALAYAPAEQLATSPPPVKHAAILLKGVDGKLPSGLARKSGVASRRPKSLFDQDKIWEPRLDNGYPNVVPPGKAGESWQVWYGDCIGEHGCETQILLYANSTDGLSWQKPELGLFDIGSIRPDMKQIGKKNNIVLEGGGIGVYKDPVEKDPTKLYKAFGPACYDTGDTSCGMMFHKENGTVSSFYPHQDLAYSADGLRWTGLGSVAWPDPQRYDCHNNLMWDPNSSSYVATTRDGFSIAPGRAIGIARSRPNELTFDTSVAPKLTLGGTLEHQLYSQITFPWLDAWLGIVMVYKAEDPEGKVYCRLAWADSPLGTWQWVEENGLTGTEFIPTGPDGSFDSHVCFAAAHPVSLKGEERIYYIGSNGPHSGARNSSFGLATLRTDGYAAVRGSDSFTTTKLRVTGTKLTVTVDFDDANDGSLQIGLSSTSPKVVPGLLVDASVPLKANSTDAIITFKGGADFSSLVGEDVVLEVKMSKASLYTVGFAS